MHKSVKMFPMGNIPFTKEGYEQIKKELQAAEERRPEVVKTLTRAREMGDLSENGFYKGAKFELSDLDRKIRHLKNLVQYGQPLDKPSHNDYVQIGHTVTLRKISE